MLISWAVSAVHKETKQFFTLYNTLDDRKVYLEKEVRAFDYLFLFLLHFKMYCGVGGCVCGDQRAACGSRFSPYIMWAPGLELQSLGLAAGTFTLSHRAGLSKSLYGKKIT